MKQIFLALLFPFAAHAVILDSSSNQTIYMHPTPTLTLSIMDMEKDGGLMTISLDYDAATTQMELANLQAQNPNRKIQVIPSEPQYSTATLTIPEINFQQELSLSRGQMGPIVGTQILLNKEQMAKLLLNKTRADKMVQFSLTAKSSFMASQVLEDYSASSDVCSSLNADKVKDLILSLGRMQKPAGMKYSQTFDAFKGEILSHCFATVNASAVASFKDLLGLRLQSSLWSEKISAQYTESKSETKVFPLTPHIKVNLN